MKGRAASPCARVGGLCRVTVRAATGASRPAHLSKGPIASSTGAAPHERLRICCARSRRRACGRPGGRGCARRGGGRAHARRAARTGRGREWRRGAAPGHPRHRPLPAVTLLAAMPELGRRDRSAVASLGGVAPRARESGKWRGHRFTGQGRRHVRRALHLAVLRGGGMRPPHSQLTSPMKM
ncbi:MAG: hypothetical protein D6832_06050 [Alphaproteobacteria bacterium]|nr:MAG: hypothetical protein D6832_06050 [Alphaproteobacteria bacterium]